MQRRYLPVSVAAVLVLGIGGAAGYHPDDASAVPATSQAVIGQAGGTVAKKVAEAPQLTVLTPASDPTTRQTISFTTKKVVKSAYIEYGPAPRGATNGGATSGSAADGSAATSRRSATRRPATSKTYSGSTAPRYTATLVGLTPDTQYRYRVVTSRGSGAWSTFRTAAEAARDWSLLAFGDSQIDNAGVGREIVDQALAADPQAELMLSVGDVVNRPAKYGEWRDFFKLMGSSATDRNWVVSIGNHEQCILTSCRSGNAQAFRSYFNWPGNGFPNQGPTWYFVDYQGVRIVVLDVFGAHLDEQALFLDYALANNPNKWSIVLMHASPFAGTPARRNEAVGKTILPIISKHSVDLVLTGHDHSYARGYLQPNGTQFAISVSGPKYYVSADADWIAQGATRVAAAQQTSTYQQISFTGDELRYRAVVAYKGSGSNAPEAVGETLDEFVVRKDVTGVRTVS
ncbi:MAG: metallophosphoesterase [Candidatus Nanopelagicales bacterium]